MGPPSHIKSKLIRSYKGEIFSIEFPSSQLTLAHVKLATNSPGHPSLLLPTSSLPLKFPTCYFFNYYYMYNINQPSPHTNMSMYTYVYVCIQVYMYVLAKCYLYVHIVNVALWLLVSQLVLSSLRKTNSFLAVLIWGWGSRRFF